MIQKTLFLLLAAASAPAFAQVSWHAGVSGGQARTDSELVANRESTITDATGLRTDFDAQDSAWKGFFGLRLNPVVALELAYADLGRHRTHTTMLGGQLQRPAAISIDRRISGYGIDLVATPPLGWRSVSVFGRIGAFRSRLEATATLEGNIVFTGGDADERARTTTRQETVLKTGLGGEWWFRPDAALRLEWERYHEVGKPFAVGGSGTTGEADTDVVSLGVLMRF
ncbi:MAG TPA: outer membrane beta-barrel protein [Usitatibacter sp.]|nr:outer membrane beta-barrel protein [Usitatibacter sp.]